MSTYNTISTVYSRTHKLNQHVLFCTVYHSGHCTVQYIDTILNAMWHLLFLKKKREVDGVIDEHSVCVSTMPVLSIARWLYRWCDSHRSSCKKKKKHCKSGCYSFHVFFTVFWWHHCRCYLWDSLCRIIWSHNVLDIPRPLMLCSCFFFSGISDLDNNGSKLQFVCVSNLFMNMCFFLYC